jgi:hypothetical protein
MRSIGLFILALVLLYVVDAQWFGGANFDHLNRAAHEMRAAWR